MPVPPSVSYTARWIFPVAGPPLPYGTITIQDDKIAAVEPRGTRRADVDFGNAAILPGFVNAHTHLDLTGARGVCPPSADFTQWLTHVIAFRRIRTPAQVQTDIASGLAECLASGATLIGDISSGGASWDLLAHANCRSVVFHELLGLGQDRAEQSWQAAQAWRATRPAGDKCVPGLSPHAPYSVRRAIFEKLIGVVCPVAIHLAESQAEVELLRHRTGPFMSFLQEMQVWDPCGLVADPLEVVQMAPRGIFVHGNYLAPQTPFTPQQSLIVCPQTHGAFGHLPHPFPRFLPHVRIALGTDSLASNPGLDILAEARFLRQAYPEVEPAALLRMLTLSGAEALGFATITGSLVPGKSADLVVLPLSDVGQADPHDLILQSTLTAQGVMFCGEWVRRPGAAS